MQVLALQALQPGLLRESLSGSSPSLHTPPALPVPLGLSESLGWGLARQEVTQSAPCLPLVGGWCRDRQSSVLESCTVSGCLLPGSREMSAGPNARRLLCLGARPAPITQCSPVILAQLCTRPLGSCLHWGENRHVGSLRTSCLLA